MQHAEAFALFQQIIDPVRNGQDDPQLLSQASLGQQARITSESETDAFIDEAHFYARLAAQGTLSSSVRLYQVAENISHPENEVFLQKHIADPLVRRLLIAYLNAIPVDAVANDGTRQIGAYYPKVVATLLKAASSSSLPVEGENWVTPFFNFLEPDQKYLSDANTYLSCADAINNISGVNSWVGSEEQYRIQQSGTKPFNHVEHYRWRAAKFAEKAASLLPRKSQASLQYQQLGLERPTIG
ncbi:hypothetical protein ACFFOE_001243 [Klebsiella aerogenes]